jgi:FkbM family methyltransferase
MKEIMLLARFCYRFGAIGGCRLFLRFKLGNTHNMKVPGIKHPVTLRPGTSDIPAFYQVFLHRHFDISLTTNHLLTPHHIYHIEAVIDGGANIGLFAVYMKNKYPEAKIICVEPDPGNFEVLQKNVSQYSGIYCENCGLWSKDTKLKVYDKYGKGFWAMVVEEDPAGGAVPAISIGTLIKKYGIEQVDICKIDIETSEKQLFAEGYEAWLPKVNMLIVELHDWMEKGCSKPVFEAVNKSFAQYEFALMGESVLFARQ